MLRRSMRSVVCKDLIGPAGLGFEADAPEPAPPGQGEIAIDVMASGVNFPDVLLTYGKYQIKPSPPFSPGCEVAGRVHAVGPGVSDFRPGDHVMSILFYGGFAERVVVPMQVAVRISPNIPFIDAAATPFTYGTAEYALAKRAKLRAGETLLVLGAAGGTGIAAIEVGRHLGARVIAAASTEEKLAVCREKGAHATIDYSKEDLKRRVKDLTDDKGVDVVFDPVGGDLAEPALRAIAWEGRYLVIGFASGTIPSFLGNLVLLKGCQVIGVSWGGLVMRDPKEFRDGLETVASWLAEGAIHPHIDRVLPFADAAAALTRIERREVQGKLVLVPTVARDD